MPQPRELLLTGATGFTGSHVLPRLSSSGWHVRCLVRPRSRGRCTEHQGVTWVEGDLDQPESLLPAFQGVEALVNVASLGFGHAAAIVEAAEKAGVTRAVFLSTTAIFTRLNAPSKAVRLEAERRIRESSLRWTVLRPTMVYGTSRDRNMCRLLRYLTRSPVIPVFGTGEYLQQPVHVEDLADAVVAVVECPVSVGHAYNISGADALTYNRVVDIACELLGWSVRKLHVPVRPAVWILGLAERLRLRLPLKAEQVLRLNEHKAFDHLDAQRDFGFRPRSFRSGIASEIREMGLGKP